MNDMISRQAAIDALMEILDRPKHAEFLYTDEICKTLNELPSVEPDWDEMVVICDNCGHAIRVKRKDKERIEKNDDDFEKKIHGMFDHIWECEIEHPIFQDTVGELMGAVIQLHNQFVQPERTKGKWISEVKGKEAILDEFGNVTCSAHCSECGDWLTASDEYSCRGRYCPNCVADMRGEKDEQR